LGRSRQGGAALRDHVINRPGDDSGFGNGYFAERSYLTEPFIHTPPNLRSVHAVQAQTLKRAALSREDFANPAEIFLAAGVTMPSQIESGTLNPLQFSSNLPIARFLNGLPWIAGSLYR
jgi:hypothetical protein